MLHSISWLTSDHYCCRYGPPFIGTLLVTYYIEVLVCISEKNTEAHKFEGVILYIYNL